MSTTCWSCSDCIKSSTLTNHLNNFNNNWEDNEDLKYLDELPSTHSLHHIIQILKFHPSYLRSFLKAFNFIVYNDGPLSSDVKIYIAIMAASRHQCHFLITSLTDELAELNYEGSEVWLLGLKMAPKKLRELDHINRLLAHQPWLLTPKHIQDLAQASSSSWTMTELTQALVILSLFHSLSSLFYSCGIGVEEQQMRKNSFSFSRRNCGGRGDCGRSDCGNVKCGNGKCGNGNGGSCNCGNGKCGSVGCGEDDRCGGDGGEESVRSSSKDENQTYHKNGGCIKNSSNGCNSADGGSVGRSKGKTVSIVEARDGGDDQPRCLHANCGLSRTLSQQEANGIEALLERMKLVRGDEDVTSEEKMERFNRVERQSAELVLSETKGRVALKSLQESNDLEYSHHLDFIYQDFAMARSEANVVPFPLIDFNWSLQAFSITSLYYPGLGEVLDEKFQTARKLTYNTIGTRSNVDTTSFRTAIWMYTQCMYGLMDDSYDYDVINALLEEPLRSYIKVITCFPESVTKEVYDLFMVGFLPSEKTHVNIMIQEAKFEAELLYGLKAISDYRNQMCM